jgi:hypothetical protein
MKTMDSLMLERDECEAQLAEQEAALAAFRAFVRAWQDWRDSRDDCPTDGACEICDDLAVRVDRKRTAVEPYMGDGDDEQGRARRSRETMLRSPD